MLVRLFRLDAMSVRARQLTDGIFALIAIALVWAYYLYIDYLFFNPPCEAMVTGVPAC